MSSYKQTVSKSSWPIVSAVYMYVIIVVDATSVISVITVVIVLVFDMSSGDRMPSRREMGLAKGEVKGQSLWQVRGVDVHGQGTQYPSNLTLWGAMSTFGRPLCHK